MITRATLSTIEQGLPKYRSMLAGNSAFIPTSYESIATVSVGAGGSSTITFSSIPSTFTHLQIRALIKQSNGDGAYMRFNSDSGTNYTRHRTQGNGTSVSSGGEGGQAQFNINTNLGWSDFGILIMDILDYKDTTKAKTIRHFYAIDRNGSGGGIGLESGAWLNTNAVTTISFVTLGAGNYSEYSHFALYGIKSA